jgi:hypothetical protein
MSTFFVYNSDVDSLTVGNLDADKRTPRQPLLIQVFFYTCSITDAISVDTMSVLSLRGFEELFIRPKLMSSSSFCTYHTYIDDDG